MNPLPTNGGECVIEISHSCRMCKYLCIYIYQYFCLYCVITLFVSSVTGFKPEISIILFLYVNVVK